MQPLEDPKVAETGYDFVVCFDAHVRDDSHDVLLYFCRNRRSSNICQNDSVALSPNSEETSSTCPADATKSKQSSAEVSLSPSEE